MPSIHSAHGSYWCFHAAFKHFVHPAPRVCAAVLSSASHARLSYAGLGCTLLWLAMARKALPALPVSIALAVAFYFISRFVMEPVILPMTLELIYF